MLFYTKTLRNHVYYTFIFIFSCSFLSFCTAIGYQLLLFSTNNSHIDLPDPKTLTATKIPDQSRPGSNSNEEVVHTVQSFTVRWSLMTYLAYPFSGEILPICLRYSQRVLSHVDRIVESNQRVIVSLLNS